MPLVLGLLGVVGFSGSLPALPQAADGLVLAAVALGALGYAEGGALARELGGWQTICWALTTSAPLVAPLALVAGLRGDLSGGAAAWTGFAYVSLISMFLGFFLWYAALVRGGVAKIGQVQLAQPVLTLVWSAPCSGRRSAWPRRAPLCSCWRAWPRCSVRGSNRRRPR